MYSTPIAPVLAISFSPAGISAWASPEILRWARSNSKQCGQPCRWPHVAAARSKTPDIARSGLLRRHTKRDGVPFPEAWVPDAEAGGHVHSTMMTIEPVDGHGVIVNSTARPSTPRMIIFALWVNGIQLGTDSTKWTLCIRNGSCRCSLIQCIPVIEPKTREFIAIAIDASCTHMYSPGIQRHVRKALELGASPREILAVLEMVSVLGIHSVALGVPILDAEMQRAAGASRKID